MNIFRLFVGTKKKLLKASIDYKLNNKPLANVKMYKLSKDCDSDEYIHLVLFHYARMLYIIPKKYQGTVELIKVFSNIADSKHFEYDLVREGSELSKTLAWVRPSVKKKRDSHYETILFKRTSRTFSIRSIKAKIPVFGPTSEAVMSTINLAEEVLSRLDEKQVVILQKSLGYMSRNYNNELSGSKLYNLAEEAYEYTVKHLDRT